MAFSVVLLIVTSFHCLEIIDSAPMPFWLSRNAYGAQCDKYGKTCVRNKDCSCNNKELRCVFVFLKRRRECVPANAYEIAGRPAFECFKHQHQCYHDNDCECGYGEYLHCKQLSTDMNGLCLKRSEDLPSWFTPSSPTYEPSTTPKPTTTPTSPTTTTEWQCKNLGARCVEDTDCLCENSDELLCIYFPERQDHYCVPEERNPTEDTLTSPPDTQSPPPDTQPPPPDTQPPPITERCEMFAFPCSNDTDCFCEESDDLRCVYVHDEKKHSCLPDQWTQGGPSTHEHPPSTTTPPTTKSLSTSNTRPFTVATKEHINKEPSKAKNKYPQKFGSITLNSGNGQGWNPYTETPPITKSPWNLWGTKSISVGKKKGDRITLTSSKELKLDIPVESLPEVINELDEKKLIK